MIRVQFPVYEFKIKEENGRKIVFDPFRRQWMVLTPEEWVRQNFMQYLTQVQQYPASLISIEREIAMGDVKKRFDIAVYNRAGKPWMLIECKAMAVPLTDEVLHQVMRYNQTLQTHYLVITNGVYTKCYRLIDDFLEIYEMPQYAGLEK